MLKMMDCFMSGVCVTSGLYAAAHEAYSIAVILLIIGALNAFIAFRR